MHDMHDDDYMLLVRELLQHHSPTDQQWCEVMLAVLYASLQGGTPHLDAGVQLLRQTQHVEREWRAIGKKEGYVQAPEMDEAAWRNIGEHYGYVQTEEARSEAERNKPRPPMDVSMEKLQKLVAGRYDGVDPLSLRDEDRQGASSQQDATPITEDRCRCGHLWREHAQHKDMWSGSHPCTNCLCLNFMLRERQVQSPAWQEDAQGFTIPLQPAARE